MDAVTPAEVAEAGAAPGPTAILSYALRLLWVAARLILVICLGEKGVLFFYQGF